MWCTEVAAGAFLTFLIVVSGGIGDLVAASLGPAGMKPTEAKKSSIVAG